MQPLTAPPRDTLTAGQVRALLRAGNVTVDVGAELIAPNLTVLEDISDDLEGGQVSHSLYAEIHRTCQLAMSRELVWGVDLVRPYMTMASGGTTARWNLGVYCMTTPERSVADDPELFQVDGYDRVMMLDRQVGADYTVASGANYRTALLAAFTAAGMTGVIVESDAALLTLPAAKTWPLIGSDQSDPDQTSSPATWLRIINDLLRAINFRSVWCDENGLFRCERYMPPATRGPEFEFDADDPLLSIVGEERVLTSDVWATPNRWVFRQTNRTGGAPTPTEGDGIYTVTNNSDGPTSITSRGLTWTAVIDYEAASQAILVELGNRRVAADRRGTAMLSVTTGPFPPAGHADIYTYRDADVGDRTVQAVAWEMPLDGSDVSWQWETV